jgi:hypothetical protein
MSSPAREVVSRESEDSQDLRGWLNGLGVQDFQVKVARRHPKSYKGVNVEGTLGTYTDLIDEDSIREEHGGGTFSIIVHNRAANGSLKFFQTRTVKIAGPPKVDGLLSSEDRDIEPVVAAEGGGLAAQAMASMQRQLERTIADNKAEKPGFDPSMMRMIQEPVLEQIRGMRDANVELQRALADKDARIMELINRKPDTSFQDDMLKNMWGNESARIEGLRAQHDSESRQMKTYHAEELSRIREQARDDMKERTRGHERELEAVKESSRAQIDSIKIAYEARIDGLKSENTRLAAEIAQAKGEVGELRSRKDKSLTEQAEEIVKVQEAFKSLGVGGSKDEDDDSDKPVWERALSRVMENPDAIGQLIGGVRGSIGPAPQPQAPQLPPPGQPFQGPDGQIYVSRPDGKVQRLRSGVPAVVRKKAIAAKAAVEEKQEGPAAIRPPDPTELALAIQFMESAAGNGTEPSAFVAGARSLIPSDVIAYVEKVGIDDLLNSANLEPNSVFRNQSGRNWIREVARILLEGA